MNGWETALDTCGCCTTPPLETRIFNRPGQPELDYRLDVHGGFMRRMLRRLPAWPDSRQAPLARLTTRDLNDPTIAFLDAWATVADVLTFYQERIATEGYLRTATERRSVLELARTIGYELNPGVSATAYLNFDIEDRPPPPGMGPPIREAVVPVGTKVQSLPGQNQLPQTFETSVELRGRPEWNVLRPRLTQPQPLSLATRRIYVAGVTTELAIGSRILLTAPKAGESDRGVDTRVLEVAAVTAESALNRTRVDLTEIAKSPPPPPPPPPFKPPALPPAVILLAEQPLTSTYIRDAIIQRRWTEKQLRVQRRIQFKHWDDRDLVTGIERELFRRDRDDLFEPILRHFDPPSVESHYPAAGATGVPNDATIRVTFDQPVRSQTLNTSTFQLRVKATAEIVAATPSYDEGSRTATLVPNAPLTLDTEYLVTVKGGTGGVSDPSRLPMPSDFTWTFRSDVEHIEPVVTAREPAESATEVAVDTKVVATFSEALDPSTVTGGSFKLTFENGAKTVSATVSYDDAAFKATLNPNAPLARGTKYTVVLTAAIRDLNQNALVPTSWSFTAKAWVPHSVGAQAHSFREHVGFFGHNAPKWKGLPKPTYINGDPYPNDWDTPASTSHPDGDPANTETPRTIWVTSQGETLGGDKAYLERTIPGLPRETWTILESPTGIEPFWIGEVTERSLVDYALSGNTTELRLSQAGGNAPDNPDFKVRETTAHIRSELLLLADLPIDDPLLPGDTEVVLDRMVLDLDEGRPVVVSGERRDLPGVISHEVVILGEPVHEGGFTTLRFRRGLAHEYIRRTVAISANAVAATHGETVPAEILGGGDGSQANQSFTLRKPPLTYVPAATARGSASTLEVRVDDVLWDEAPSLFELSPHERKYVTRIDDEQRTTVIFGDGARGARPPSGGENLRATYRSGIGDEGMVGADKLVLLQTRPLGIRSVTNPVDATGAEEPESRDTARRNAPLTVLTLDRIVSLRDFEDFARAFAGIGKAQAAELRRGEHAFVHLTVAAANGDEVPPSSSTFLNLLAAVDAFRDPGSDVVVSSYSRRYFDLVADVMVDRTYEATAVLDAIRTALTEELSFTRREFGQPVTAAEVVTLIQRVPGVVMTDLNALYLTHEGQPAPEAALPPILPVARARLVPKGVAPAELLLVNPAGITLTERIS